MISVYNLFETMPPAPGPIGRFERTKNFVVEKFRKPNKKTMEKEDGKPMYRTKKLPSGEVLTFAIKKTEGPEGGRTKLVNIKRPKGDE